MNHREKQVGFSQRVRLEWFDFTSNLVISGKDRSMINKELQNHLKNEISIESKSVRSNRDKIISILMNVWVNDNNEISELRAEGIELLKNLPNKKHIIIHWGMISAVYPFWTVVANNVGRLLKLQGKVTSSQIKRRVKEQFGDRETVERATSLVIRTFRDWDVLTETDRRLEYQQGKIINTENEKVTCWLIEALLHSNISRSASLNELVNSNIIFPIRLKKVNERDIRNHSERIDVMNQSDNNYMISLKR